MKEEHLLTGPLEATNEAYAIAKISRLRMCQAYRRQHGFDAIVAMPTNLYGPRDNFHSPNFHVVPALIRRISEAKNDGAPSVEIWGSGRPMREFMHVDDLANALVFLMKYHSEEAIVNVGSGQEVSIKDLASVIAKIVGYRGTLEFDTSRPNGSHRKLLDSTRLTDLGWSAKIDLVDGLKETFRWFTESLVRGEHLKGDLQ